jgi:C-5 cytosine-specific DNA methylase
MPFLLDLYCGAGGAAVGYWQAGFEVTGVDVSPQPNYPFNFVQSDVRDLDMEWLSTFDAIHASPPCQNESILMKGNRGRGWEDDHKPWIPFTRDMLLATGKPYVIENVQGAPMRADVTLCGLMFDLKVFRHRIFELGRWTMPKPTHPSHKGHRVSGWNHGVRYDGDMFGVYGDGGGKGSISDWQYAMGIGHIDTKKSLSESIPPAFTFHIGKHLMSFAESTDFSESVGSA